MCPKLVLEEDAMDATSFDRWVRRLSMGASRRRVLGGLLAGPALLLPLEATARKKGKDAQRKRTDKGKNKDRQRATVQQESCWRAGACIPKKGANVSQCNLAGYSAPESLDCTGCNLSRANLKGADLTGVNFTKANLSGACLVNADFTGATFAKNTNLANAIFCNTTMPNGDIDNSGCGEGTACCTMCVPDCAANHYCCSGTCSPCPCGYRLLSNGTCARPCSLGCGSSPCKCYLVPDLCGAFNTGRLCPNGDSDCPTGQFCNGVGSCIEPC